MYMYTCTSTGLCVYHYKTVLQRYHNNYHWTFLHVSAKFLFCLLNHITCYSVCDFVCTHTTLTFEWLVWTVHVHAVHYYTCRPIHHVPGQNTQHRSYERNDEDLERSMTTNYRCVGTLCLQVHVYSRIPQPTCTHICEKLPLLVTGNALVE